MYKYIFKYAYNRINKNEVRPDHNTGSSMRIRVWVSVWILLRPTGFCVNSEG